MGRSFRRTVVWTVILIAAVGALYLVFRPQPVLVETALVTRGRFEAVVEEDGRTRVRDRYILSAPVAGRLLRIAVQAGDTVTQGQLVARMLAAPSALLGSRARLEAEERIAAAEDMLEQAKVLVDRAAAQQTQAIADATRVRDLQAHGVASSQQLERAELAERIALRDVLAAQRRRHVAEHELGQARAVLSSAENTGDTTEHYELRAPIDARVLRVLQESEAIVPAGTPILELGDPADLEVAVDVLTAEAVNIHAGAPVSIDRWGGPTPLEGRVRRVEPGAFTRVSALGVEEQRVWVLIDLTSPREQWAGLGDGFRVDVRISVESIENVVLVPSSALFRRGTGWATFVVQDGVARERPVEIARRGAHGVMVAGGLDPGERVVLFPPSSLRNGTRTRDAQ